MPTLENPPTAALLAVDMQNGVIATAHARAAVVAKVSVLVEKASIRFDLDISDSLLL